MPNPEFVPTSTPARIPVSERQLPSPAEMLRGGHETTVLGYTHEDPKDPYSRLIIKGETPFTRADSGAVRQQTMPPEQVYDDGGEGVWLTAEEREALRERLQLEADREVLAEIAEEGRREVLEPADDFNGGHYLNIEYRGPGRKVRAEIEDYEGGESVREVLVALSGGYRERVYLPPEQPADGIGAVYSRGDRGQISSTTKQLSSSEERVKKPNKVVEYYRKHPNAKLATQWIGGVALLALLARPIASVGLEAGRQKENHEIISISEVWDAARGVEVPRGEDW